MKLSRAVITVLLLFSPGLFATPISWEEIISGRQDSRREPASLEFYLQRVDQIRREGKTPEAVIYIEVFGLSNKETEVCLEKGCTLPAKLVINSYPYWLEPGIYQLLLFVSEDNWNDDFLKRAANKALVQTLGELKDKLALEWYVHINDAKKRSVRHLGHAHVFIRANNMEELKKELKKRLPFSNPELQLW